MAVVIEGLDLDTEAPGPTIVLGGFDVRTLTEALRVQLAGLSVETFLGDGGEPDPDLPMSDTDTVTITVVEASEPPTGEYGVYFPVNGNWVQLNL